MSTITAKELAARVKARTGLEQATPHLMGETLRDWQQRGIAERVGSRWRLTKSGRAMFAAYVLVMNPADEREAA